MNKFITLFMSGPKGWGTRAVNLSHIVCVENNEDNCAAIYLSTHPDTPFDTIVPFLELVSELESKDMPKGQNH